MQWLTSAALSNPMQQVVELWSIHVISGIPSSLLPSLNIDRSINEGRFVPLPERVSEEQTYHDDGMECQREGVEWILWYYCGSRPQTSCCLLGDCMLSCHLENYGSGRMLHFLFFPFLFCWFNILSRECTAWSNQKCYMTLIIPTVCLLERIVIKEIESSRSWDQ